MPKKSNTKRAGEEHRVGAADLARQVVQAARAADAQRRYAHQRQAYAGNQEAQNGAPYVGARHLTHGYRENQVARAEEHAEEHAGDVDVLFERQSLLCLTHCNCKPPIRIMHFDHYDTIVQYIPAAVKQRCAVSQRFRQNSDVQSGKPEDRAYPGEISTSNLNTVHKKE